jgi:hypothetical protein
MTEPSEPRIESHPVVESPAIEPYYAAFTGHRCVATGSLAAVAAAAKAALDQDNTAPMLLLDSDSRPVEVDFRGSAEQVLARLAAASAAPAAGENAAKPAGKNGRGRPRLGVVAREVTLLPRHWDWLGQQPGGASVALRRLVEAARRSLQPQDRARRSQEAVYRFMSVVAGDLPDYEEALRAFYAGDAAALERSIKHWPGDVCDHLGRLLATAQADATAAATA